jgi:hypothetical protein
MRRHVRDYVYTDDHNTQADRREHERGEVAPVFACRHTSSVRCNGAGGSLFSFTPHKEG